MSHYPNYAAESHWHDDIELILVTSGEMKYNINGEIVSLKENEGLFVNSRQVHFGFSENQTECEFLCILFHPVILCMSKSFETEFVLPVLEKASAFIPLKNEYSDVLTQITEIYEKSSADSAPLVTVSCIYRIWSELFRNMKNVGNSESYGTRLTVLKNMMNYVTKNFAEKIMLADIANAGHVSKRTCGNIFKRYLNKTPVEYLTDVRLRKSIELLETADMTILEISVASGFTGASYYAETFRKAFGKTPAQYKKSIPDGKRS